MNDIVPPSKQPKRFFDVAPPQTAAPSATSRPVIVGNRPEQADPMVTPPATSSQPGTSMPIAPPPVSMPEILAVPSMEPPDESITPFTAELAQASHEPDAGTRLMLEEYKEVRHELTPDMPVTAVEPSLGPVSEVSSPAPVTNTPISQPSVSHHKSPHGVQGIILWMLVLLSLLVFANILLDAGIWQPSVELPHSDFFKDLN